ncbi:MAG TPA: AI-2E family transporter [Nitrospira sp.]|nr:AI-2E family transporter [Nitrospira sp.]
MTEGSWKPVVIVGGIVLAAYLTWELRSLILPLTVSGLLAYVSRPLVTGLERHHVPRGLAIGLVLAGFLLACLVIIVGVQAAIPTEHKVIELKVHALYALNERYKALMGLDQSPKTGNRLYHLVHTDLDPLMDHVNEVLGLTPEEHAEFMASHAGPAGIEPGSDQLLSEHRANLQIHNVRGRTLSPDAGTAGRADQALGQGWTKFVRSPLTALGDVLSTWIVAPLVFFFLLRDTGEIKRGLLRLVPNRLFEPALAILADLDHAVGDYLRGVSLSCSLLGLTITLFLALIGVPLRWAFAIGLLAAVTNVVPYLGSVVALLAGLAYAFFGEDFHPVLPMVERESLAIWVIVAVGVAELIKNAVYEPLVLGGAVRLHPLVIIIGFVGGTLMFGLVGAILAIPAITVFTVFISSTTRHLKAYGVI